MRKYHYLGSCVGLDGEHISQMCDDSVPVTLDTIKRNCEGVQEWAHQHGYGRNLSLSQDWHVSYGKSKYNKMPCYYICWSGIEFVWVKENVPQRSNNY